MLRDGFFKETGRMTKWKLITHYLRRIISLGLHPGRCFICGSWMIIDIVVPGVLGAVCPKCNYYH